MKTMDQKEFARENVFGLGAENTAYAKYFTNLLTGISFVIMQIHWSFTFVREV